jgi:transposase
MGKGYSSDLRKRVYGDIESGQSRRAAARRFGVSVSTSIRLAQRMAAKGSLEPEKQGRPPGGGKLAPYADVLISWVEAKGDITMPELAAKLLAERGVNGAPGIVIPLSGCPRFHGQKKRCWHPKSVAPT